MVVIDQLILIHACDSILVRIHLVLNPSSENPVRKSSDSPSKFLLTSIIVRALAVVSELLFGTIIQPAVLRLQHDRYLA
jgi:hypothetical protein